MKPITDVAVTHIENGPEEYTLSCKIQAKLKREIGYLWVKRGKIGALTSIRIDHGSPDTSYSDTSDVMYANIDIQLNPGGDLRSYLAYQSGDGSPIVDIILHEGEGSVPNGYTKHYRDVIRS